MIAVILVLTLSGCGSTPESSEKQTSSAVESNAAASAEAHTEQSSSSQNAAAEEKSAQAASSAKSGSADDTKFTQTLVDDDNVKFEITGIDHDGFWGYTWNVSLENKTGSNLMFTLENTSVNGVMSDPFWAETVSAGKNANSKISWSDTDFEKNDIEKVTEVSFTLRAYDADQFEPEYLNQEFSVFPYGEENAQNNSRQTAGTDLVLFDNNQCAMSLTGVDPDGDWGYTLKATLTNKTDQNLMFSIDDASMNGTMCDPFWGSEVAAGKTSNEEIIWMSGTLEDAGIDPDSITSIDLPVRVYPSDDFTADSFVDQTFTVNPAELSSGS